MKKKQNDDEEALRADVAAFAANIGLTPSQSGFNDSDFRKKGPLRNPVSQGKSPKSKQKYQKPENDHNAAPGKQLPKNRNQGHQTAEGKFTKNNFNPLNKARAEQKEQTPKVQELTAEELSAAKTIKHAKDVCHTFTRWGESGERWYQTAASIASTITYVNVDKTVVDHEVVKQKRSQAAALLKMVAVEFNKTRKNDSEMRMILSARRSGTSADKVAAMTVLIQGNPVANLQILDSLLAMVTSKGGKRHALSGVDVLKELFITSLLPDRKLKPFESQPLATLPDSKEGSSLLLWWYWEDCIKERYKKYVNSIMEGSKDSLVHLKLKSIKTLYELLNQKPEHEKELLSALVNKLGDPEKKAASNAAYLLTQLLTKHPNMKKIVLREVDLFVFRPNLGLRAVYYACVFMNRLPLNHIGDGPAIARQLVDIYFGVFKTIIFKSNTASHSKIEMGKDEENKTVEPTAVDSRLLSSLLTGVNRAFKFVAEDSADAIIEDHTPTLFRLVHSSNFNVGVQALLLLHQLLSKHQAVSDRFYRAIYSVMISPALPKSSKVDMCLALVFKVLKSDVSTKRICALMKRLLQVASHQSPELCCACLLLMSEVLKVKPLLWNFVLEPAIEDDESEHFKDVELPDSVEPPSAPADSEYTVVPESGDADSDSDMDVRDDIAKNLGEDDSESEDDYEVEKKRKSKQKIAGTKQVTKTTATQPQQADDRKSSYDPRHRDPLYCKADQTCWWELTVLASHIHPSVSTMAKTLLSNTHIVYSGDPIHDLAFSAFLDRFAEKKPKAPKKALDSDIINSNKDGASNVLVGMELAGLAEDEVAPADLVFHRFYSAKAASQKGKRKKKNKSDDFDDDFLGSDEEMEEGDRGGSGSEDEPMLDEEAGEEEDEEIENGDEEEEEAEGEADDSQGDDSENEEIDALLDAEMSFSDEEDDADESDDDEEFVFDDTESAAAEGKKQKVAGKKHENQKKKKQKMKKKNVVSVLEDSEDEEKAGRKRRKKNDGKTMKPSSFLANAEDYKHLI